MTFLSCSAVVFRARTAAEEGEPRMYFPIGVIEGVLVLGTTLVCRKWSLEEGSKGPYAKDAGNVRRLECQERPPPPKNCGNQT